VLSACGAGDENDARKEVHDIGVYPKLIVTGRQVGQG
jgi:hypothetical protein